MKTSDLTKTALFTAILCIIAPISIPIGPVPISLGSLALYFLVYIAGTYKTLISYGIYFLLGIVGLPVFSGYSGGLSKVAGPTGGYLIGFVFLIAISGFFIHKYKSKILHFIGMVIGTAVAYAFGTAWYCFETQNGVVAALMVCVFPFIIGDCIKMILAIVIGSKMKNSIGIL